MRCDLGLSSQQVLTSRRKLSRIVSAVTEQLYGGNVQPPQHIELSGVLAHYIDIAKALDLWKSQLPSTLGAIDSQDRTGLQEGEGMANLVRCLRSSLLLRYHNVRMLLSRPLCLGYLHNLNRISDTSMKTMVTHVGRVALGSGIRSATETIDILNSISLSAETKAIYGRSRLS